MTDLHSGSFSAISRSRLECLFDGIFAIAITILVLELRVPELADHHSADELAQALLHHISTFGSYLLSFLVLGIFWYRHNQQYRHFREITNGMLVMHFVQLASAAFFPFCAALLGRYPGNSLSGVFYMGCILLYVWASFANWIIASRFGALVPDTTPLDYQRLQHRALRGCLVISVFFSLAMLKALTP